MAGTNIYGQMIRAQLENSASDLTPTATGLIYFNTTTGPKWYSGAAWLTAADLTTAQTLTNKSLTSPTLLTPLVDDYLDINEEAAPATPASGKVRVYAKADGKLYRKVSAGTEFEMADTTGSLVNPMDSQGDLIVGGVGGVATKLDHPGVANRLVKSTSSTATGFSQLVDADVDPAAAISGSKLQAATSSNVGTLDYYETTSFVATYNGGAYTTTPTTDSVFVTRIGKVVTLTFDGVSTNASNTNVAFFTAAGDVAARFRPVVNVQVPITGRSGANNEVGNVTIGTDGMITFNRDANGSTNYTSGTVAGYRAFSITYQTA